MVIEALTIIALGAALPADCPKHNVFRLPNRTFICKQPVKMRGTNSIIPRKSERTIFNRTRNRGYTKVRNITKPLKEFGNQRYARRIRRTRRTIRQEVEHILQDYDRAAEIARIRATQKAYSDKRKR